MRSSQSGARQGANIALVGFLLGIGLGLAAGLVYTWVINPVMSSNVAPWQLNQQGQDAWIVNASVAWASDGDLPLAADWLNDLRLGDQTFQRVADLACTLARSSYAQSSAGLVAIRSMVKLAETQGRRACASDLILVNTPTAPPAPTQLRATLTLIPPATKTPTPEPRPTFTPATAPPVLLTSTAPSGRFVIARYEPFCNARTSGVIEALVSEANGTTGIRGVKITVEWPGSSDTFFTGLKPDRDDGFADFKMTANETYRISLPGQSDVSNALVAQPCTDRQSGGAAVTSYRVYFRRGAR